MDSAACIKLLTRWDMQMLHAGRTCAELQTHGQRPPVDSGTDRKTEALLQAASWSAETVPWMVGTGVAGRSSLRI